MLPEFIAAGLLDRDGLLVDGFSKEPTFHIEHAAATFISLVVEAERAGQQIPVGAAREVQLSYEDTVVILRPVQASERGLVLGLAAKSSAMLGKVRMVMDRLEKRLTAKPPEGRRLVAAT
jgi:predicted regulator of Ras-like GTPase activity (Roadblock/LC7/MglB family)